MHQGLEYDLACLVLALKHLNCLSGTNSLASWLSIVTLHTTDSLQQLLGCIEISLVSANEAQQQSHDTLDSAGDI